ncbi:hypothetical protein OC25_03680 [Pedobacter kyungheensis]|uniref:Resolvase, N terminal domain n=2 Tax=Pedobacter TaxID=84567 RepID=A0A1G6JZW2_9SPHI|nr:MULTISPECIES: recombinase family protein [Pedobacter]KIA96194.1 hypothetical protein OC25_03680 [Pedobacter kyungheensis]SDC24257.1 Resolvase, N terminal domain [Pedobacter soli]
MEGKVPVAIGYARTVQSGDPHDLDRQSESIYNYCKEHGIELRVVLCEEGERSLSWDILERMVQNSVGRLDMVVVAEMDNLFQDVGWLLLKQAQFETEYGVIIVSAGGSELGLDNQGGLTMG